MWGKVKQTHETEGGWVLGRAGARTRALLLAQWLGLRVVVCRARAAARTTARAAAAACLSGAALAGLLRLLRVLLGLSRLLLFQPLGLGSARMF